jgi:hypothetical protein
MPMLTWAQATPKVGAARIIEMFAMLRPQHFGYAEMAEKGARVALRAPHLAIDQRATLRIDAETLSAGPAPEGKGTWDFEIRNMAVRTAPESRWTLKGRIDLALEAPTTIQFLELTGPGGLSIMLGIEPPNKVSALFQNLQLLHAEMSRWFQAEAGFRRWLDGIYALLQAPLEQGGFGLTLNADARETLDGMLSESAGGAKYVFAVEQAGPARIAQLKRLPDGN